MGEGNMREKERERMRGKRGRRRVQYTYRENVV